MMKVTRTTMNMMQANRRKANMEKNTVLVQFIRKDGTWGKPTRVERYGKTDEQVIEYLSEINNKQVRLAQ